METKSRHQMLEEVLRSLCRVKFLNYEVMDDLLKQLRDITTTKGDEESSLLMMVNLARKELKKSKNARNESEKAKIIRKVLGDITNDLTVHIRIFFQSPADSDQALLMNG